MTAGYESPELDGPEFDLEDDLRGALRAGLAPLHNLAETAGVGEEQVDRVVGAAWDAFTGFSARSIDDYNEVLDLAIRANGWSWAEAVLVDPRRRESLFQSTTLSARRYARKLYQRLDAEGEAAADDAVTHLSRLMLADRSSGFKVPAWSSTSVVRRNVTWRLNTAATQVDSFRKTAKGTTLSLDAYWEALGESWDLERRLRIGDCGRPRGRGVRVGSWRVLHWRRGRPRCWRVSEPGPSATDSPSPSTRRSGFLPAGPRTSRLARARSSGEVRRRSVTSSPRTLCWSASSG